MSRALVLLFTLVLSTLAFGQMMKPLEIDEQGRVTFRVEAAGAGSVQVVGKGNGNGLGTTPIALSKSSGSTWTVTTGPIRPGFHYYDVLIDGVASTDLQNHAYFGWGRWTSGLEVQDPSNDFYTSKPGVPRGEIRFVYYDSTTTGRTRRCLVYVPAGYDANPEAEYPVLFLQHGNGESESAWLEQGKVNFIMDNLIHEGKAVPMLVVMDNGFAAAPGASNWYMPAHNQSVFPQLVTNELVPRIEQRFRVRKTPEGRAIAGLSMGGQQASSIVIRNPDTFAYLGMFSGGLDSTGMVTSEVASRLNREMKLIWIGTGLQDEFLNNYILVARNRFLAMQVNHQYEAIDGTHEWQVWRKCLHRFAPKLFQPNLSSTRIDLSYENTPDGRAMARVETDLASLKGARWECSKDLKSWSEIDGSEAASVSVPIRGKTFVRLAEVPWNQ